MLIGEITTKVDAKGRSALPKKLRQEMSADLILTRGFEGTLVVVDKERWDKITREVIEGSFISRDVRDSTRFLVGGAQEIELDTQGRFIIPKNLREYAKIDKEIVFVGLINWVEIWDAATWQERIAKLATDADEIAQRLADVTN